MDQRLPLWRRGLVVSLLCCASLVLLSDWLFYARPLGWSLALFALAVLGTILFRRGHALAAAPGRVLTLAAVGLIGALIYQPGPLVLTLTVLALVSLAIIDRVGWTSDVWSWVHRWAQFVLRGWAQWVHDSRLYRRYQHARSERSPRWLRLIVTWLLPITLSGVFVALFALANPIISQMLDDVRVWLADAAERVPDFVTPMRVVLWLGVAMWVWALLRVRPHQRRRRTRPILTAEANLAIDRVRSPQMIVRCLVLFNVVFAVQNVLDARYLWGGAALPDGMTYAQYAHRGAYPLVVTALLAAVFVLGTFTSRQPKGAMRNARRLVVLWIAQNVFLMIAAAWRLNLYVDAYSLTRLRVAAGIWMVLVALGLVWIVLRIMLDRDNAWLLRTNVVTAALVLYACAFVNFDGRIAMYNVTHSADLGGNGVAVDLDYMQALGPEAIPALHRLADGATDPQRANLARWHAYGLEQKLREGLVDWRGWTLRKHALAAHSTNDPPTSRIAATELRAGP